jgi:hypothetical protein
MNYALTIKQKQLIVKILTVLETINGKYGNSFNLLKHKHQIYSIDYMTHILHTVLRTSVYSEEQRLLLNEIRNIYIQHK